MISKNKIRFIRSLAEKKFRKKYGLFIAEGTKTVHELLDSEIQITEIFSTAPQLAKSRRIAFQKINDPELKKISLLATPNESLAVCKIPENILHLSSLQNKLSLVLDRISDPGNLGTIIRIADWFGIENVICSHESADAFNPKTVQATMGSISRVKVHYAQLENFLNGFRSENPKSEIYGAVLEGENIFEKKMPKTGLIVIGNESQGISKPLLPLLTHKISIPRTGKAESLNAAAASAIICAEFRRTVHASG